jgi:hypothetical protein
MNLVSTPLTFSIFLSRSSNRLSTFFHFSSVRASAISVCLCHCSRTFSRVSIAWSACSRALTRARRSPFSSVGDIISPCPPNRHETARSDLSSRRPGRRCIPTAFVSSGHFRRTLERHAPYARGIPVEAPGQLSAPSPHLAPLPLFPACGSDQRCRSPLKVIVTQIAPSAPVSCEMIFASFSFATFFAATAAVARFCAWS